MWFRHAASTLTLKSFERSAASARPNRFWVAQRFQRCDKSHLISELQPREPPLQLHPQNKQQIDPQQPHEMPVVRGCVDGAPPQWPRRAPKPHHHPGQPAESAHDMNHMHPGEDIKEGAVRIGRKIQALRAQLQPCQVLPNHEYQAQQHRKVEPKVARGPSACPRMKVDTRRRASSRATLLATSARVLNQRMGGRVIWCQSVAEPSRT